MYRYSRAILRVSNYTNNVQLSRLHVSSVKLLDPYWRMKNGLPENPSSCGPLTDWPDYSFKDGRPVPYGIGQKRRIDKQREYAARIIKLVGEVDRAVEMHAKKQEEEQLMRQKILDNKLKPKGSQLLKDKELKA